MIAEQGRDTHFAHNLENALVYGVYIIVSSGDVVRLNLAIFNHLRDGGKRHVRVDDRGAVAEKKGEVHNFTSVASFYNNANLHTLFGLNEVVVNGSYGEKRWHRSHIGRYVAVAQNDIVLLSVYSHFCGHTHVVQSVLETYAAAAFREEHRNGDMSELAALAVLNFCEVGIADNRTLETEGTALERLFGEEVAGDRATVVGEAHYETFTN